MGSLVDCFLFSYLYLSLSYEVRVKMQVVYKELVLRIKFVR